MPTKPDEPDAAGCTRRTQLGVAAAVGASWSLGALAEPVGVAARLRPRAGNRLVFAAGERGGQLVAQAAAPALARWPRLMKVDSRARRADRLDTTMEHVSISTADQAHAGRRARRHADET